MLSITTMLYEGGMQQAGDRAGAFGMALKTIMPVLSLGGMAIMGSGQMMSSGFLGDDLKNSGLAPKLTQVGMGVSGVGMLGSAATALPGLLKNTANTYKQIRSQQKEMRAKEAEYQGRSPAPPSGPSGPTPPRRSY